jgi:hypothetical protein
VDGGIVSDEKRMRLRYAGTCRICATELPARTEAWYDRSTRTVRCLDHDLAPELVRAAAPEVVDPGTPGASARRELERRRARREERLRAEHPLLAGLIHALTDDPPSTKAWETGAVGEERLGAGLNHLISENLQVLHDRRIPGTRANIDHLAVTGSGVYVIDTKKYAGRPRLAVRGGLLRPRVERLMVGGRNCTALVDGVLEQIKVVRGLVGEAVPVHGVLCFVDADWPRRRGAFSTRSVTVLSPERLYPQLRADGPIGVDTIHRLHRSLGSALSPR